MQDTDTIESLRAELAAAREQTAAIQQRLDKAEQRAQMLEAAQQTIQEQSSVLAELSTPLIPISDEVLAMPLIGRMDTRRAQHVIETLLDGISKSRARVAIIDITGVAVVDTQVANALIMAAKAVQLLGAKVVLTGIRPEVAQTLVTIGADLGDIVTCGTLKAGIAYATRLV